MRITKAVFFVFSLLIVAQSAHARDSHIEVTIDSSVDPMTTVGLVLTSDGLTQVVDTTSRRINAQSLIVTFPIDPSSVTPTTLASAMMVAADGEVTMGNLRPIRADSLSSPLTSLPECTIDVKVPPMIEDQAGNLSKLVEIRSQRRTIYQQKLSQLLSGDFLEKMRKLERGFGLSQKREIEPDMPPLELIDRLSRLKAAIENYELNRAKK